ncbi:MAG: hypothetical protein WC052_00245 [Patescibacteria group bacterium]
MSSDDSQQRQLSRRGLRSLFTTFLLVIGVLVAGYAAYAVNATGPFPSRGKWQAVFLANGQVYFGKLSGINRRYVTLSDIYYLQVSQGLQQAATPEGAPPQGQPNINLIKLGQELHGPEDAMHIERSKVLFWENLKDDSRVVEAISQTKQ